MKKVAPSYKKEKPGNKRRKRSGGTSSAGWACGGAKGSELKTVTHKNMRQLSELGKRAKENQPTLGPNTY